GKTIITTNKRDASASLIDVAWMLFTFAPKDAAYSVTFDEPENHLHPELQKALLPSLLKVFPNVQFVVATHNPLVLASVPDSNVYVLRHDEAGLVRSHLLDTVNRAGTANEILRDVLGLEFTMPLWVGAKLDEIVKEFAGQDVTYESLGKLRVRLDEAGLGTYVPEAIGKLVPHETAK
ncbi:MAG: AAA family ATPase, partial [Gemmataceae bacterium]|nr:AAA family ATPase [Gemmataceae bacterium]